MPTTSSESRGRLLLPQDMSTSHSAYILYENIRKNSCPMQRQNNDGCTQEMSTSFRPSFSQTNAREVIAELEATSFRDDASWADGMADIAKSKLSYS